MAILKELVQAGIIKYIGLSECTAEELRRAHMIHPITAVQMEWSLQTRDIEAMLVPVARELGKKWTRMLEIVWCCRFEALGHGWALD